MSNFKFTEEQKEKLKVLNKKYMKNASWSVAKCFFFILLANFLVFLIDLTYLHSKIFVSLASFTSGFCFSKLLIDNFRFLGDSLKTETLKILQSKE